MITKDTAIAAFEKEGIEYIEYNADLDSPSIAWEEASNDDYSSELSAYFDDTILTITAIRTTRIISLEDEVEDFVSNVKVAIADLYENAI